MRLGDMSGPSRGLGSGPGRGNTDQGCLAGSVIPAAQPLAGKSHPAPRHAIQRPRDQPAREGDPHSPHRIELSPRSRGDVVTHHAAGRGPPGRPARRGLRHGGRIRCQERRCRLATSSSEIRRAPSPCKRPECRPVAALALLLPCWCGARPRGSRRLAGRGRAKRWVAAAAFDRCGDLGDLAVDAAGDTGGESRAVACLHLRHVLAVHRSDMLPGRQRLRMDVAHRSELKAGGGE